jgi:hypothetical protein
MHVLERLLAVMHLLNMEYFHVLFTQHKLVIFLVMVSTVVFGVSIKELEQLLGELWLGLQ